MTHWRQRLENPKPSEVYDAIAAMLFWIVLATPFLAVWLGVVIYRNWQ